jgi:muramidase (phage lysozyme)
MGDQEYPLTPANGNMTAFLALIRHSEGTDRAPNPYAVTFGYKFTITDFSNHPAALGWPGYAYQGAISTAAGAYQIIRSTWLSCQRKMNLSDFTPPSQDSAAVLLIAEAGAMHLVDAGQIPEAITKCSGLWASLPGSTSGQPQSPLAALIDVYGQAGGHLA